MFKCRHKKKISEKYKDSSLSCQKRPISNHVTDKKGIITPFEYMCENFISQSKVIVN